MGLRWHSNVQTMLKNDYERSSHAALRALRRGARKMRDQAVDNAPVDLGTLEDAIKTEEERGYRGRVQIRLFVDESTPVPGRTNKTVASYAVRMHEGVYNLGPKSLQKQSAISGAVVGRKYLERAVDEHIDDTEKEIAEAVAKALQGIGL